MDDPIPEPPTIKLSYTKTTSEPTKIQAAVLSFQGDDSNSCPYSENRLTLSGEGGIGSTVGVNELLVESISRTGAHLEDPTEHTDLLLEIHPQGGFRFRISGTANSIDYDLNNGDDDEALQNDVHADADTLDSIRRRW
ncbi:uncharacterized protein Z519_07239 [Cladophialophora bantiana CBS 173.52]|uniref:Uncharacterized protein n=1 Tax=Cladophialophora bantiana (strain ATCC 10958 / CBS 173.52 / CDC B-1940 / NIH 8579) TaxID=1442370 RepID=A0A0D2HN47_CLAB1|nr:uncharacterized protein Z519_07239 [Cladophialophora bantiana CBS 173.52]KIW92255.1 hypothetical protein Z519_07239 [Cladophialophora bantiana CBS 173.52]